MESVRTEIERLRRRGADVIDLSPAAPRRGVPGGVFEAAREAFGAGGSRPIAGGDLALREALVQHDGLLRGSALLPSEIAVADGVETAISALSRVLFAPGDDVMVFAPYPPYLPAIVRLTGARPVFVPTSNSAGGEPRAEALGSRLTPAARGVMLCRPAVPSGSVVRSGEFRQIAALAAERGMWLVSDESRATLVFDGEIQTPGSELRDEARDLLVVVGATGRHLDFPGMPLGWLAAASHVLRGFVKVLSHAGGSPSSVSAAVVRAALDSAAHDESAVRSATEAQRNVMCDALNRIPGLACRRPAAGDVALVGVQEAYPAAGASTATEIVNRILQRGLVATLAGEVFGAPDHIVLSFAAEQAILLEGARRIRRALEP